MRKIPVLSILLMFCFIAPSVMAADPSGTVGPTSNWFDNLYLDRDGNRIDDNIDQYIQDPEGSRLQIYIDQGYLDPQRIPVFVVYSRDTDPGDIDALEALGDNIRIEFVSQYLDVVIANDLTIEQIRSASKLPGVVIVEFQKVYAPLLDTSVRAIKARESSVYSPYTAAEYNGGYTGAGITVAVLDTGVDDEHESLDGKFIAGVDFQDSGDDKDGTNNPDDKDGHGTHCAGTAIGTGGTQGTYMGVAPDATLVDVKVLTDWGFGGKLYEGIEWCISQQDTFGIDVLSISIGEMMGGNSDGQDSNGRIAQQAVDNGMVVVAAIGNDGNEHIGISSPAAADNVIAVGALDDQDSVDRNDDWIADFSNSGPREDDGDSDDLDELKPDVTAPGVGIQSANSYNGNLAILKAGGYASLSGTSMACPHVAGTAALELQQNLLSPDALKAELKSKAENIGLPSDQQGAGLVDAENVLK